MRRIFRRSAAVLAMLLVSAAPALAVTVADIVDLVSQDQYAAYHADELFTHYGDNREWGPEHDRARDNIFAAFGGLGLDTTLHEFSYNSSSYYNVVAVHPGRVTPEQVYVIGAHYDSSNGYDPGADDSAPGADDNASGVAAVLEAARVLSQFDFESTVTFVAFDREEQGMKGSWAYANDHQTDDIRGMISADMIAFNPYEETDPNYHKARIGYARANALTGELAAALDLYGGLSAQIHVFTSTDHVPFDQYGFNAACLMEYALSDNPNYHRWSDSVDTPDYINYPYAADMTRGIVGYLATAAVPVPEPGSLVLLILGAGGTWILIGRRRGHR